MVTVESLVAFELASDICEFLSKINEVGRKVIRAYLVDPFRFRLFALTVSDIGDEDGKAPHAVFRHSWHGCG